MRLGLYGFLGIRQSRTAMNNHQLTRKQRPVRLAFIGGTNRLLDLGGKEALGYLSLSSAFTFRALFSADVIITIRWWDPIVIWIKLLKPGVTTVFVADGHFSLLGLNSRYNKRSSRNIFEYDYCDVYLLPDRVGLQAVEQYPGVKRLYRPAYWTEPGLCLLRASPKALPGLVFVYGNDPYFSAESRSRLLKLVNEIVAIYESTCRISHLIPDNSFGRDVLNGLNVKHNVYIGLEDIKTRLPENSTYFCTPSTMVWRLLSGGAPVALLDVYDEDMCFHSSIPRIKEAGDCERVFIQAQDDMGLVRQIQSGVLGSESLLEAVKRVAAERRPRPPKSSRQWHRVSICTFRDYMSSIRSILSGR